MATLKTIVDTALVGLGLAVVFYWLAVLFGRANGNKECFKWWLKVIVIQGVILAAALKVVGLL